MVVFAKPSVTRALVCRLHHPSGQAIGGGRARAAAGSYQRELLQAGRGAVHRGPQGARGGRGARAARAAPGAAREGEEGGASARAGAAREGPPRG